MMQAPLTVRCACGRFERHGPARVVLEAIRRHRADKHPELRETARKRLAREPGKPLHIQPGRLAELEPDERDALLADRTRRARLHGIEAELMPL
jgi:hypothetical protein